MTSLEMHIFMNKEINIVFFQDGAALCSCIVEQNITVNTRQTYIHIRGVYFNSNSVEIINELHLPSRV